MAGSATIQQEQIDALLVVQVQVLETLCGDATLQEMLDAFVRTIERQSGEMLCSILLLEGHTLRHGAAPSLPEEYNLAIDGATIGPAAGSCGTAAYTKKTIIVSDIATDPLWADYRHLALCHGLQACWSTPILSASGEVLGTFALYYRTPRKPNERERRLMAIWSDVAALAIRRKQAEEALRAEQHCMLHLFNAQEYERQLTAYEIHDGILQYTAAAIMHLESYRHTLAQETPPTELQTVTQLLRKTLEESRHLINGLRPPVLDEYGVVAAIEHLVQEQSVDGPECVFEHTPDFERLAPSLELAIFRIAQEACTNAKKYSGSAKVEIVLKRQGNRVHLEVRDWGKGFTPSPASTAGLGLRGIRERVRLLGGTVAIHSRPGEGTCVTVDLPVVPRSIDPV